ncbi:TonB-dependent receptor [Arcobacter venerupis]|uniref:TonB-dependent receptor n=1 Tax=Arcobacter venerupis TaxID=1054033 RepID=A0AAE7B869_9BACT|nr:TonB-dependent receptor [Arcobacter venerupis]QKF67218.1 TonB-dependent receptor [Arcobacter venerupis]RWS48429.1 TonB-dependent receptor [Arcobacter venerupis]
MSKKLILSLSVCTYLLANDSIIELNQISVTQTKQEEQNLVIANSISKKDKNEIDLDQATTQKELLNSLSGVRIEQTSSGIGHTTAIRMPNGTNGYYLFMQDGIAVQSSGFFNHNGLAYTSFENADNVEVLKGAGSALYGSDAVAATINVNSLEKPSKQLEREVKTTAGSFGFYSAKAEMSDTIDEKSAYRANVSYSTEDGYREHTSYDRVEANLRYDYKYNDENILKTIFNYTKTDAEQADSFSDYSYITDASKKASDKASFYTALNNTDIRREFDFARLSVDWANYTNDNLEIVLTPYIRFNENKYVATWEKNLPSNDTKIYTLGLLQRNTLDTNYGEVIFGFDTEYTDSSLVYNQDFATTASGKTYPKGSIYDYDVTYTAIAPYVNNKWEMTDKLDFDLGARFDYNKFDYKNNLSTGTDASGVYYRPNDKEDSFTHFSPKASFTYKLDETTTLYTRYANGFTIPSATKLYSMKAGYSEAKLDPETTNTYEVGFKKEFEKAYVESSLYFMNIEDTITTNKDADGNTYYLNGGKSEHKGMELTLFSNLTEDISSKIAYSYSKHNFVDDDNYKDNEMAEAPNHTGNFRLFYNPYFMKKLTLMGEIQYVGDYYMNNENTKKYSGYEVGNVKGTYNLSKSLSIFGKVTNITDKKYATSASSSWSDSYTPGNPRAYYAGLNYKF